MYTKYDLYHQFVSDNECKILVDWIYQNHNSDVFTTAKHPGTIRKTTRFSKNVVYPNVAYTIQGRIDNLIKHRFSLGTLVRVPSFPDGMYGSYGSKGDSCMVHRDPRWIPNFATYHFNVTLSDHKNADLYIDDNIVELKITDAVLYPVSEISHYTTELTGATPRLFWCFGYCIPLHKTNFKL